MKKLFISIGIMVLSMVGNDCVFPTKINDEIELNSNTTNMKKMSYILDSCSTENKSVFDLFQSKIIESRSLTTCVFTPKGSSVQVLIRDEYSNSIINEYNQMADQLVPNAVRISTSTAKYNCHSYAWYCQSTDNPYWMNDPSQYYTDGSYYEVASPRVGDKICYFDDNDTPNDKSDDLNLHSGIVTSLSGQISNGICGNANIVNVTSKWGSCGLYSHNGVDCPYTSSYGGDADYVKYYREAEHTHVYDDWVYYDRRSHIETCNCGATGQTTRPHVIFSSDIVNNKANCLECGHLLDLNLDMAITAFSINDYKYSIKGSYMLPNGIVILVEDDIDSYFSNTLIFYNKNEMPQLS